MSVGPGVDSVVLGTPPGPVLHLLELGATVHRLEVTCGDGVRRNVVLNHGSTAEYLDSGDYLGSTIGRYANRIAAGRFTLDGEQVRVGTHERGNHLHGGPDGFDRRVWSIEERGTHHAVLSLVSPDGDQGFPGTVRATARFTTTETTVRIDLEARTDRVTVVNLTNHAYFNLDGSASGTTDEHTLVVSADQFTPVDPSGIPTGGHQDVSGTPFDFRAATRLGDAARSDHEQVRAVRGIDHNFVLTPRAGRPAAVLASARTATTLRLYTDQPGLQVYTGNSLDGSARSQTGRLLRQGDGVALEPQLFPDTPNRPEFPPARLAPGEIYRSTIRWQFGALSDAT